MGRLLIDTWRGTNEALTRKLTLRTEPIAFKGFDRADDLERIEKLTRPETTLTFCQLSFMARVMGRTIGGTRATTSSRMAARGCRALSHDQGDHDGRAGHVVKNVVRLPRGRYETAAGLPPDARRRSN